MKHFIFLIHFTLFLIGSNLSFSQNIDQQIGELLSKSFSDNTVSYLEDFYVKNEQTLSSYWKSYIKYRQAVIFGILKNSEQEEKYIHSAIEFLENIPEKNAEEWILLALSQNYELKFASMFTVPFKSAKITDYLEKAEKLDSSNPRLFLAKGIQDMYTPPLYGGMKNAENYFKKSINLYTKFLSTKNNISWGYEDSYIYLIKFYLKNKDKNKASLIFYKGLAIFPNSTWFINNKNKFNHN